MWKQIIIKITWHIPDRFQNAVSSSITGTPQQVDNINKLIQIVAQLISTQLTSTKQTIIKITMLVVTISLELILSREVERNQAYTVHYVTGIYITAYCFINKNYVLSSG